MSEERMKALDEAFRLGFDAGVEFEGQGDPSAEWPWDLPDYRYGPPTIECPHWEPGHITLRRGCTACEAESTKPIDPSQDHANRSTP